MKKLKVLKNHIKKFLKKNNDSIRELKSRKVFILPNTDISEELLEANINNKNLILKNKDNQKNEIKQYNRKLQKNNSNNKINIKNKDKKVSTLYNKNSIIKSVPRMKVNLNNYNFNNFSVERKRNNELYQVNSY